MSGKVIQPPKAKAPLMRRFYDSGWMYHTTMIMASLAIVLNLATLFLSSANERSETYPDHAVVRQVDQGERIHRTVLETEDGELVVLYDTVLRESGDSIYIQYDGERWSQTQPPR